MKKFTQNIAEKIIGSDSVRVAKSGNYTCLKWGKDMSQIGSGFVYFLSWEFQDGKIVWIERDSDYNIVENTGMTCICDDLNLDGDGLFVTIEVLEAEKEQILAIAAKIYAEQAGN
jgi:hypothetical protein